MKIWEWIKSRSPIVLRSEMVGKCSAVEHHWKRVLKSNRKVHEKELSEIKAAVERIERKAVSIDWSRDSSGPNSPKYRLTLNLDGLLFGGFSSDSADLEIIGEIIGHRVARDIASKQFVDMANANGLRLANLMRAKGFKHR